MTSPERDKGAGTARQHRSAGSTRLRRLPHAEAEALFVGPPRCGVPRPHTTPARTALFSRSRRRARCRVVMLHPSAPLHRVAVARCPPDVPPCVRPARLVPLMATKSAPQAQGLALPFRVWCAPKSRAASRRAAMVGTGSSLAVPEETWAGPPRPRPRLALPRWATGRKRP